MNGASEKQQIKNGIKKQTTIKRSEAEPGAGAGKQSKSKAINNKITIERRRNLLDQGMGGLEMGGGQGREGKGYGFWRVGVRFKEKNKESRAHADRQKGRTTETTVPKRRVRAMLGWWWTLVDEAWGHGGHKGSKQNISNRCMLIAIYMNAQKRGMPCLPFLIFLVCCALRNE